MDKPTGNAKLTWNIAIACGVVGLMGGVFLGGFFFQGSSQARESPFEWGAVSHLPQGKPFRGLDEVKKLPQADQDKYHEGLKALQAGADRRALAQFESLIAAQKTFPLAYGMAVLIHLRFMDSSQADSAMAVSKLSLGISQAPDQPWLQYVAGRFWEQAGREDSARTHYQKAISLSRRFAYPYVRLGRLQMDRGETGLATRNLKTAIALMETSPEIYRAGKETAIPPTESAPFDFLATLYYQSGADDSARIVLEYGQEHGRQTGQMALVQGWLWESRGFLEKADSLYRGLLAAEPGNPQYALAQRTLGWKPLRPGATGSRPGGPAEAIFAISLLDPLAQKNPRNAPLWMALGQAYYHRGLFGMATECFDSSLKNDPTAPGLQAIRDVAYSAWLKENTRKQAPPDKLPEIADEELLKKVKEPLSPEEQTPVVIPGSIALLGTYNVPWGSSPADVRRAYPRKNFRVLPNGNMEDVFMNDGAIHEYLLAFKDGKLWGVRIFVTDSSKSAGDLFGRLIRTKTKISGEGKGTGEASCSGYLPFQGAIWENDDTFEFMAQFSGKENQIRLARLGRDHLPKDRRLCDLVAYLKTERWDAP